MNRTFCTIITANYLPYAQALGLSLTNQHPDATLHILISDESEQLFHKQHQTNGNNHFYFVDEICKEGIGEKIKNKYQSVYHDAFRWSMKPVFLNYLIQIKGFEKVIYIDCDVFFFDDFSFLFDELNNSDVLLTPHWRSSDPHKDLPNFKFLFTGGLFNGGFVGVNKHAVEALNWWAMACEFDCKIQPEEGQYVDQTYLNLFPVYFDKIKILTHHGCNVANWNQLHCQRQLQKDGNILINRTDPIVFIHFTPSTIKGILNGEDSLLITFLEKLSTTVKFFNPNIDLISKYKKILNEEKKSTYYNNTTCQKIVKKINYFIKQLLLRNHINEN